MRNSFTQDLPALLFEPLPQPLVVYLDDSDSAFAAWDSAVSSHDSPEDRRAMEAAR